MSDDKTAWYRNGGGSPPTWTPYTISTIADYAFSVFATDVGVDVDLGVDLGVHVHVHVTNGVCAYAEGHSLALGDNRVMERRRWGRGSTPGDPRGPALPKPKGAVSPLPWGVVCMGLILCSAQRKVQHAHQSINWTWGLDRCVLRGSE